MFYISEVSIFVSRKNESLLMKRFTLIAFLLFFLFTVQNTAAQSEKKTLIVESEVTQVILTVNGNIVRVQYAPTNSALEIYNILGVKVSSYKIDSPDKTLTLNLPKGCYILKIGDIVRRITIK